MRRWSELGQVERVDVYTRISLYLLLWLFVGTCAASAAARLVRTEEPGPAAELAWAGWLLVVLTVATVALRDVMDVQPPAATVPWRSTVQLLVVGGITFAVALWLTPAWADRKSVV